MTRTERRERQRRRKLQIAHRMVSALLALVLKVKHLFHDSLLIRAEGRQRVALNAITDAQLIHTAAQKFASLIRDNLPRYPRAGPLLRLYLNPKAPAVFPLVHRRVGNAGCHRFFPGVKANIDASDELSGGIDGR